ncbi:response regulator [Maribacter stanieri]|uniref:response regulator n=1 Tax=Maribacter stanieri TaxID=440514 RepID=UPI00249553BE|nr:response regulator [Maribacter stanieri]|tara:strand:+ start:198 stop:584 length:387 start_codon:yes stop_codon:yes gene_type:complete
MLKILIIEDDEITNFITKTNLEKFGYKNIAVALNGQEGLDYLKNNTCPDLILLDINMPILDGWDFLEATTRLNLGLEIPVVVITSSIRFEDRSNAELYSNVIDYMEKPINFEELNNLLANLKTKKIES